MTDKICHLCGIPYKDSPFLKEQPAHTPQECLNILRYRRNEAEFKLSEIKEQLKHAERKYHL